MTESARERRVYFLRAQDSGAIKVGSSMDQPRRQREVQVGNHEALVLLGTCVGGFAHELMIKTELKPWRLRGEWFRGCPEVVTVVARCLVEPDGEPIAAGVVREVTAETQRDWVEVVVREWLDDCVEVTGEAADTVTMSDLVSSLSWWVSATDGLPPPGSRNLIRAVTVECMVEAGARLNKHTHRMVGARIR